MITCEFDLIGISPLGFSKHIESVKLATEGHDDFEQRTWRQRMHVNKDGHIFIPPQAMKHCLQDIAKYLQESVPGKKGSTYTKHFKSGIVTLDELVLCDDNWKPIPADSVQGLTLFVPSNGVPGGSKKVNKTFPVVQSWRAHAIIQIIDMILIAKPEKIEEYAKHAGQLIGLMMSRPANGGYFGRFLVENFAVTTKDIVAA